MPFKRSKAPPLRTDAGKIFVRCWFCDGPSAKGCPNPDRCRYVHPADRDWVVARGAPKLIRCNYFFDNGMPKGNGCPLPKCSFLHPDDTERWIAAGGRHTDDKSDAHSLLPERLHTAPGPSTRGDEPEKGRLVVSIKMESPVNAEDKLHKQGPTDERTRKPKPGAGRCRFFDVDGYPINGGCPWKGECAFVHPQDPEWNAPAAQNYKTIRCAFVDSAGEPLHGGCKHPRTCSFLHPEDIGWKNAPRLYKTCRCNNFADDGHTIGGGCPNSNCTHIHPQEEELWETAPARPNLITSGKSSNGSPERRRSPRRVSPPAPRRQWGGKDLPSYEFKDNRKWSLDEKMRSLDERYPRRLPSPSRARRYDDDARRPVNGKGRRSPSPRRDDRRGRDRDRRSPGRGGRRSPSPRRRSPVRSRSRSRSPMRHRRYKDRRSPSPVRRGRSSHKSRAGPSSSPKDTRKLVLKQPGSNPAEVGMSVQVLGDENRYPMAVQALERVEEQFDEAEKCSKTGLGPLMPIWTALENLAQFFPMMSQNYEEGIYSPLVSPISAAVVDRETVVERTAELQRHISYLLEIIQSFEDGSGQSRLLPGSRAPNETILARAGQVKTRLKRISSSLNLIAGDLRDAGSPGANPKSEDGMDVDRSVSQAAQESQEGLIVKWWRSFKLAMARFGALKGEGTPS